MRVPHPTARTRRLPVRVLGTGTVAALVATLCAQTTPAAAASSASGSEDLAARTGHTATFARHAATGQVRFFGTAPGRAAHRPDGIHPGDRPEVAAKAWLTRYGAVFGVPDPADDLAAGPARRDGDRRVVHLRQTVSGLPVVAGELVVTLDSSNDLVSVSGETSPDAAADATPAVPAAAAAQLASRYVARAEGPAALTTSEPELSVLDERLLGGPVTVGPTTVWALTVSSADRTVRHQVYVDADRGRVLLDLDRNPRGLQRVVCSAADVRHDDPTCPGGGGATVADENNPPTAPGSGGDRDAYDAFRFSGAVHHFYATLLGRDSIDGQGMTLASTVHYCTTEPSEPCPGFGNAFWDGHEMVYGDGYASALDVVGHELTHGVTEHTAKLFNYYQSGAINESLSDVMGELVQQLEGPALNAPGGTDVYDSSKDWMLGEDLPSAAGTRSLQDPTDSGQPDRMTSALYSAHDPWSVAFDNGGVHDNDGVNNKAAYLLAVGGSFNGQTLTGLGGASQVERNVKLANLYYEVQQLLTPGSDYADLYVLLPQACKNVSARGSTLPLPAGGTTGLTSADCVQVGKAVLATEMNRQPTSPLAAIGAPAPTCTNGGSPTTVRLDAFDTAGTNPIGHGWTKGSSTGRNAAGNLQFGQWWWSQQPVPDYGGIYPYAYSSSGKGSLWGDDADPTLGGDQYDRQDSWIRTTTAITARIGTFVRYNSAWDFDYGKLGGGDPTTYFFDGGRVEYTVDSGAHWYDAGAASAVSSHALIVNGLYNGTISDTSDEGYVDTNTLRGRRGYVGSSHGWTSSRIDLSSLAGRSVQLRWRIGADDAIGSLGWYLDDVHTYSCNPTTLTLTAPAALTYGSSGTVTAHLVRSGTTTALGGKPVQLWQRRKGTTTWNAVGTAKSTSTAGNASWPIQPSYDYEYRAAFAGSAPLAPSGYVTKSVPVKVAITKSRTPTTLTYGLSFGFSGSVAPQHAGKAVFLQRYYNGKWNTLAKRVLSASSTYSASDRPTAHGSLSYRMLFPGDSDHTANTVSFTVTVS